MGGRRATRVPVGAAIVAAGTVVLLAGVARAQGVGEGGFVGPMPAVVADVARGEDRSVSVEAVEAAGAGETASD